MTARGTYPVGVNVPPSESVPPPASGAAPTGPEGPTGGKVLYALWPVFAGLAGFLLIAEWLVYIGAGPLRRRTG